MKSAQIYPELRVRHQGQAAIVRRLEHVNGLSAELRTMPTLTGLRQQPWPCFLAAFANRIF